MITKVLKTVLLTFVISLLPQTAMSAQKIAAGAPCKSLNAKATVKNKTYTCIKKGTKLVWNSGIAIKSAAPAVKPTPISSPTPTSSPIPSTSPTPTPTPTPTPQIKLPAEGSLCTKIGEKVLGINEYMRCSWSGHANSEQEAIQGLRWRSFQITKVSNSKSNNYPTTPSEGTGCNNSGDTYDVTGGTLECRWIKGRKLQWFKINTVKKTFTNAVSPVSIDTCKLQMSDSKADRTGRNAGGGMVGFPLVNSDKNGMLINGTNEVLIVPIDFPDFPGGPGLKEQLEYDIKWMKDWYNYFSNGQSKFNVTTFDNWVRMSKNRSAYPTIQKNINATSADSVTRQGGEAQNFITEISQKIDLRKFSTVYLFYPEGDYSFSDLIIRNYKFQIKEGEKNLNFFSWGRNLEGMETLKWSYYIHETLHDFNIIGHAPGNGWPLGIMTNQSGISYAINPWEQFVLGWLPSDQVYCDDAKNLKTTTISLSPVEREDRQTKMAVIKLSPTKAIVVESHGIDKWSNFNFADRNFAPGFYSIMAYVVDLDKQVAAPVNSDASSQSNDEWAWAVWQKVDGGSSNSFNRYVGDRKDLADYVAVLGDTFTIEGIKIKFVATGDYETIEISKA